MQIKEILTEKPWEEFLTETEHSSFLQSWAWGELQERLGLSHRRIGFYEGGKLIGVCLAVVGARRLGNFIYVPHGPVFTSWNVGQAKTAIQYLKDLARKEGVDYLRVEPKASPDLGYAEILKDFGFRKSKTATIQAGGRTLLLDLALSQEDILMQMRKTTRYLVRRAGELGVEIQRTSDPKKMNHFHRLMEATYHRQGFIPHSRNYLQTQFEVLSPRRMAELSLAEYQGNILSAAITVSYGDTTSYVHGASVKSEIPASYLLLWENIKEAKKDNRRYFDFWGIAPEESGPNHPWYGYSLFKRGFGGFPVDYVGAWDYSLTPKYLAVAAVEQMRKLIRGV